MEQPEPATDMPDGPISAAEAREHLDESTHVALAENADDATIVGATQIATHYLATARFIDALDVPLDGEFVGWRPGET